MRLCNDHAADGLLLMTAPNVCCPPHPLMSARYLMSLQQLTTLWLADNPCTKLPHYRAVVVANLPKLENLDNVSIK